MQIYCTQCQATNAHTGAVLNGEFVFADEHGHFIKFPRVGTVQELHALIHDYEVANNRPVVTAEQERENQALMQGILDALMA